MVDTNRSRTTEVRPVRMMSWWFLKPNKVSHLGPFKFSPSVTEESDLWTLCPDSCLSGFIQVLVLTRLKVGNVSQRSLNVSVIK